MYLVKLNRNYLLCAVCWLISALPSESWNSQCMTEYRGYVADEDHGCPYSAAIWPWVNRQMNSAARFALSQHLGNVRILGVHHD